MHHYDLAIDKYWVTHSVYFRLATILLLGIRITDSELLSCNGIIEKSVHKSGTKQL